jgi:hypothetical protein
MVSAAAACYLLGPEVGEPPSGGDEDAIIHGEGRKRGKLIAPFSHRASSTHPFQEFPRLASLPRFCGVLARSFKSAGSSLFRVFIFSPSGGGVRKRFWDNNALLLIPFYFAPSVTPKGVEFVSGFKKAG